MTTKKNGTKQGDGEDASRLIDAKIEALLTSP